MEFDQMKAALVNAPVDINHELGELEDHINDAVIGMCLQLKDKQSIVALLMYMGYESQFGGEPRWQEEDGSDFIYFCRNARMNGTDLAIEFDGKHWYGHQT